MNVLQDEFKTATIVAAIDSDYGVGWRASLSVNGQNVLVDSLQTAMDKLTAAGRDDALDTVTLALYGAYIHAVSLPPAAGIIEMKVGYSPQERSALDLRL